MKKTEVKIEKHIYNVIRFEHLACDGDDIEVYNFTTLKGARNYIKGDMKHTKENFGCEMTECEIGKKKMYFAEEFGSDYVEWEIRKLPLEVEGVYTIPGEPVKYVVVK